MNLVLHELNRYEKWLKMNSGGTSIKPDYKYKSFVLSNRLDKSINKILLSMYNHQLDEIFDSISLNIFDRNTIDSWLLSLIEKFGVSAVLEAIRINNARYHRISRLRDRVESIISYKSYFLTLTFNNNCLNHTQPDTRREYVTRFLKSLSTNYVANIDFGKKNHREHYHALVQCNEVNRDGWTKHGFICVEEVILTDSSVDRLSKYVAKLSNHAIKETTRGNYMIYPKIK